MFRVIFYLLLTVIVISIVRSVIGVLAKGFSEMVSPQKQRSDGQVPLTGELKKDPVCGTYTAVASSVKQTIRGETIYFCSPKCRDKYVASH
ncbi:MAG TPA: hypothetical protein VKU01_14680 [Bryobacteraceae bacterium]|nr:hypothetical protein [Bryobacteraceae bacterium]